MKKYLFSILFLASSALLVFPFMAEAQTAAQQTECDRLKSQIEQYGGGRAAALPKYCNVNAIYTKVINFAYYIVAIAAVISLIYGGYLYMTAASNDAQRKKAKNVILWTLAGVVVVALAGLIVTIVINLVVDNKVL